MVSALEVLTALSPGSHGLRYLLSGGLLALGSMLKACFDRCMSPDWRLTADGCRSRLLSRLFELTWDPRPEIRKPLLYMQERLLHARLQGLLYENTALVDTALKISFKEAPLQPSRALVFQAASYLDEREKDPVIEVSHLTIPQRSADHVFTQSLASVYLQSCNFEMDPQLVPLLGEQLQEILNLKPTSQGAAPAQPPTKESTQASQAPSSSARLNLRDHVWRRKVKQLVEEIILPDAATWMEDDFRPHEVHTVRRVVDELSDRFNR
jgi:serine/threonine-protein kinase ATR